MCKLEILYYFIKINHTILSNIVLSISQIMKPMELWQSKIFFVFRFFNAVSYMVLRNVLLYNMLGHVGKSVVIHFREWLGPNHSVILHALQSDKALITQRRSEKGDFIFAVLHTFWLWSESIYTFVVIHSETLYIFLNHYRYTLRILKSFTKKVDVSISFIYWFICEFCL